MEAGGAVHQGLQDDQHCLRPDFKLLSLNKEFFVNTYPICSRFYYLLFKLGYRERAGQGAANVAFLYLVSPFFCFF